MSAQMTLLCSTLPTLTPFSFWRSMRLGWSLYGLLLRAVSYTVRKIWSVALFVFVCFHSNFCGFLQYFHSSVVCYRLSMLSQFLSQTVLDCTRANDCCINPLTCKAVSYASIWTCCTADISTRCASKLAIGGVQPWLFSHKILLLLKCPVTRPGWLLFACFRRRSIWHNIVYDITVRNYYYYYLLLCSTCYFVIKLFRVTTCLENLEMLGNLTAVREMSGILLKVREVSGKNLVRE